MVARSAAVVTSLMLCFHDSDLEGAKLEITDAVADVRGLLSNSLSAIEHIHLEAPNSLSLFVLVEILNLPTVAPHLRALDVYDRSGEFGGHRRVTLLDAVRTRAALQLRSFRLHIDEAHGASRSVFVTNTLENESRPGPAESDPGPDSDSASADRVVGLQSLPEDEAALAASCGIDVLVTSTVKHGTLSGRHWDLIGTWC
ncbi:hypothetical protein MIND_00920500 [Mycena indigotica]|uniref:Uncharacterized protein n=1 Tax=Mycena indigotica TaxID=2126181 RepID=A0A8H6SDE1_9AGAR|nr:uncharacterized protein MIND_00920500 [Mycena indigotica]KAF7296887.1 hypothetical protein MIND_00920500 [Mycena indigotica]